MSCLTSPNHAAKTALFVRILNIKIRVLTNSLLLKNFIEQGFHCSRISQGHGASRGGSILKGPKAKTLSVMLKDVTDIREIRTALSKLIALVLKGVDKRYWIFHAAAFSWDSHATVVFGDGGTGKSSLCFAAGLSGARILGDEPVLIDKKSHQVVPFRYLLKLVEFHRAFPRWRAIRDFDFDRSRFVGKQGPASQRMDFNFFTRKEMRELNIRVACKSVPLKRIVFLEKKKYDAVIHLYKHCLNQEKRFNFQEYVPGLNGFIRGKSVVFLQGMAGKLRDEEKMKTVLNKWRRV